MDHYGGMAEHPLTRGEIAELADRLRGLIAMVDNGEMTASTAMRYRLEGAVVALEVAVGRNPATSDDILEAMVSFLAASPPGRRRPI